MYNWDVLVTYHWDVVEYFIWDLFETSRRRTDGTSSLCPLETSSRYTNKTSWRRTTETLLDVSFETYLRHRWDVQRDALSPGGKFHEREKISTRSMNLGNFWNLMPGTVHSRRNELFSDSRFYRQSQLIATVKSIVYCSWRKILYGNDKQKFSSVSFISV